MRIAFLECVQSSQNSIDAHVRQCFALRDYLRSKGHIVSVLFNDTMENHSVTSYDVLIVSYASFYANFNAICQIINNNPQARLFWLTNEYDLGVNGSVYKLLKERQYEIIANFEENACRGKGAKAHHCLNLNLLFYKPKKEQTKKYTVCYFGTYRKDRAKYFKKYFQSQKFILSSSDKNFKKFASIGCMFRPVKKFNWGESKDTLGLFKYSLYIEDEFTHSHFNNLADRFYEALSNAVVTLFDRSCISTIKRSELGALPFESFIVDNLNNIDKRDYYKDWEEQKKWIPVVEQKQREMLERFEQILI